MAIGSCRVVGEDLDDNFPPEVGITPPKVGKSP